MTNAADADGPTRPDGAHPADGPFSFAGTTTLVVGGSSGIGHAVARTLLALDGRVLIASRSAAKLASARDRLVAGGADAAGIETRAVDTTDPAGVDALFAGLEPGSLDHLVVTASRSVHGPFADVPVADVEAMFASKFFGPYRVVKEALPTVRDGGSIALFSGVLSRRPGVNTVGLGAVNGAVEALARGLALELGPRVRVNCISPGMVRTEVYDGMPAERREAMYAATGASLPLGRVGEPDEIALATVAALANPYLTGQVIDIDGGHTIRQYATR